MNQFMWSDLAFSSKKPLKDLDAIFIAAPREISAQRIKQLLKDYLPKANVVIGVSTEDFVVGLEGQPQFAMLQQTALTGLAKQVQDSKSPHKLYTLQYSQSDLPHILNKALFQQVLLVNASWHHSFHTLPAYYALVNSNTKYKYISAFTGEEEARAYEQKLQSQLITPKAAIGSVHTDEAMMNIAMDAAKSSYDYGFQTGAALGAKQKEGYKLLGWSYNAVVPFQTHALLHGASREAHFSPPNDLNHYDTVHAEVMAVLDAHRQGTSLKGATLFVNLMPCPHCARMLSQTGIADVVYFADHSDGYAVQLLQQTGKTIRRLIP